MHKIFHRLSACIHAQAGRGRRGIKERKGKQKLSGVGLIIIALGVPDACGVYYW